MYRCKSATMYNIYRWSLGLSFSCLQIRNQVKSPGGVNSLPPPCLFGTPRGEYLGCLPLQETSFIDSISPWRSANFKWAIERRHCLQFGFANPLLRIQLTLRYKLYLSITAVDSVAHWLPLVSNSYSLSFQCSLSPLLAFFPIHPTSRRDTSRCHLR